MATRAELEELRLALNRVSGAARANLRALLAKVDPDDRPALAKLLTTTYPQLLGEYGTASAALAADMAESWAEQLRIRPRLALAAPLADEQAAKVAEWALKQPNWQASLISVTDKLVKQPFRDTIQDTAHASGVAWARVPSGAETCAFCLMAASRGAVYRTQQTAGADRDFHGDCDCGVVMVRDESDYPEGYDPSAYFDIYSEGRAIAQSDIPARQSPSTKAILSAMRQVADVH